MPSRHHRLARAGHLLPLDPRGPTLHPPGSPGKLAVLCRRRQRHYALWHPKDAVLDRDGVVRVPLIHPLNHRVTGYTEEDERAWRALLHTAEEEMDCLDEA